MPQTSSAKKRLRQNAKRQERNKYAKKGLKIQFKNFEKALATGSVEAVQQEYNLCAKKLDRAAAKNVIHRNKAARKKSQLAKKIASLQKAS